VLEKDKLLSCWK